MSISCAGVSTFSFIRSISVVPPARNRMSAPCCAVFALAAAAIAWAGFFGRMNSNVCMTMLPALVPRERCSGRPPDLLDGGHDVLIGPAAADVAVHVHGASAALSVVAAFFRAGEGDGLAQAVEQRRAWVHAKPVLLAVDAKHERHGAAAISCSRRIGSPALPRDIGRIHRADDSN